MKSSFLLLALIGLAAIGELALAKHSNLHEWTQYKKRHGKVYDTLEEDARRFSLYLAAKEQIRQHNANEQASYKMGLSHLSDWTQEEFTQLNGLYHGSANGQRGGSSMGQLYLKTIQNNDSKVLDPIEIDWRQVPNRVTAVKDQGKCASDWAFATTGLLEGLLDLFVPSRKLVSLSAQQLIDCSRNNNKGCHGGTIGSAMDDVSDMNGIESDQDYPYIGAESGSCQFNESKVVMVTPGGIEFRNDDVLLKSFVARNGPIAIGVHVNDNFRHYKSGIFNDATCGHLQNPDHAALIVGFGIDPKEGEYWIVKNSWSTSWGEEGYIRIKRGLCGIGELYFDSL
uniref:Cathepsin L n=1 Tax=Aceria tosichella TaxID=561515 RepID=A0A6G1SF32_9ACAR